MGDEDGGDGLRAAVRLGPVPLRDLAPWVFGQVGKLG